MLHFQDYPICKYIKTHDAHIIIHCGETLTVDREVVRRNGCAHKSLSPSWSTDKPEITFPVMTSCQDNISQNGCISKKISASGWSDRLGCFLMSLKAKNRRLTSISLDLVSHSLEAHSQSKSGLFFDESALKTIDWSDLHLETLLCQGTDTVPRNVMSASEKSALSITLT